MKIKKYNWLIVMVISVILLSLLMINNKTTKGKDWVIGMSQCNLGEPWRVQMNKEIKDNAERFPNLKVIFKDAQNDTLRQVNHVEEFIAQKVDLIIISPKETAPLTAPVAKAIDSGIPVFVLDRKVIGDKYTCFIGADNVKIGHEAGSWAVNFFDGKANIVELKGLMTSSVGQERHQGFMQAIKDYPLMKIIYDADTKWLEPEARVAMASALARFEKIDLVFGHNDPTAHGAYIAAESEGKGREKTIKIIGVDALPYAGLKYVRDGILSASFEYQTGAKEAIELGYGLIKYGNQPPKNVTLSTRIYTFDNVSRGGDSIP